MKPLAIVGNGITRKGAPLGNPNYDVWTMNNHAYLWQKIPTAIFEMHPDAVGAERYDEGYKDWLKANRDIPVWMHERNPHIPASIPFPREEISGLWGGSLMKGDRYIQDFYTSTTPYMLALALFKGYSYIELYGIDLNKEERIQHRDCVFFWLGILSANNVEVVIPEDSPLIDGEALYPIK